MPDVGVFPKEYGYGGTCFMDSGASALLKRVSTHPREGGGSKELSDVRTHRWIIYQSEISVDSGSKSSASVPVTVM